MYRYFLELAYNGSNYCGWQVQPNEMTIQEKLEDALSKLLGTKTDVVGAGRTDSGVHASYYVAHFESDKELDEHFYIEKLNRMLPRDISIMSLTSVDETLHARFDATSRTYYYYIIETKNPFKSETSYRLNFKLDYAKMNEAAKILYEIVDFTSFSKLHTEVATNNCTVFRAEWVENDGQWVFVISANRFLRNMVRAVVGTLIEVGKGKLSLEGFRAIIDQKDRGKAGMSVPAHALFLANITYPEDRFQSKLTRPLLPKI